MGGCDLDTPHEVDPVLLRFTNVSSSPNGGGVRGAASQIPQHDTDSVASSAQTMWPTDHAADKLLAAIVVGRKFVLPPQQISARAMVKPHIP